MHIAFVHFTGFKPTASWSETAVSMVHALRGAGHKVTVIEPRVSRTTFYLLARKAMYRMVGQHFHAERHRSVALELARSTEEQLAKLKERPDLVLGSSSLPMAYLRTPIPTAFWTDATFASMLGFYQEFSALSTETVRSGHEVENLALARCTLALYSSEWAARSAIKDHRADPRKVHVIPFGPNLSEIPSRPQVLRRIAGRDRSTCRLVFIGYDWERKQGALAMAVRTQLHRLGVPAELTVVGAEPGSPRESGSLNILGRLNKQDPKHRELLEEVLSSAHFLVVPSKAECYGMIYAEAAAFGVPSVALDVGGVGTVVHNGRNGLLFDPRTQAATIAERIADVWRNGDAYEALATSTRDDFEQRLDWPRCIELLATAVSEHAYPVLEEQVASGA